MARELIVATNPARPRKRKTSAKQRAAARRNIKKAQAAQRRRRNPSRTRSRSTARAAPKRRRTVSRRAPRRRNPVQRRSRRLFPSGLVERQLMPALIGGAGGVGNDVAYNLLMNALPAGFGGNIVEQFRTGPMRHLGKAGSALVLSYVAGMALPRKTADQLGAGALTVVGYNVVRDLVMRFAPDVNMGMYLDDGMGMYLNQGMSAYPGAGWNPNWKASGLARTDRLMPPQLTNRQSQFSPVRSVAQSVDMLDEEYA